jgi:hypothetical protein
MATIDRPRDRVASGRVLVAVLKLYLAMNWGIEVHWVVEGNAEAGGREGDTRSGEGLLGEIGRARIRGHDQDHVVEMDLLAVMVGERAVIHDPQQDVE